MYNLSLIKYYAASACLVLNPVIVDSYAVLLSCAAVFKISDLMTED